MRSNFFSTKVKNIDIVKNKTLSIFSLLFILILLNGCSKFYGYQPPAPIYGETNPYDEDIKVTPKPYKTTDKTIIQSKENNTTNVNIMKDSPVVKRSLSPAVLALVSEADRNSKAGDLESAVSTIERALRIDSRNPTLTYKLAQLRLKQSKPRLAEDLAKKAALLSANDKALKRKSWLLISEARRQQKNYYGAKEAKLKADNL